LCALIFRKEPGIFKPAAPVGRVLQPENSGLSVGNFQTVCCLWILSGVGDRFLTIPGGG